MKRIVLIGNPNVGKSVLFSRLTGANVIASNYPGTTVDYLIGKTILQGERVEVIDAPGTYSLQQPSNKAEEVAAQVLDQADVVINVVDATNLERNLNLTLQLLKSGKPVAIVLNLCDEAKHKGVRVDADRLERILGVPVVLTCALSGEGVDHLVGHVSEAKADTYPHEDSDRWREIGRIVEEVQHVTHHHASLLEVLETLSVRPWTGIPIALGITYLAFQTIRFLGEGIAGYVFAPLFERLLLPIMTNLSDILGPGSVLHTLLIGSLVNGKIDFEQSMGLLTTGLFVPFAMVLPYVFGFYFVLSLLEDLGYLPRLAVLMDTAMHRIGLHGLTVIPFLLGLGCKVPGILSARMLETRRQRFIASALVVICVPCAAQTAVIVGLLGRHGAAALAPLFGTLALLWIVIALLFKRFAGGESPEIFTEIPPYRIPYWKSLAQKVWLRTRQYIVEAVPFIFVGVLIANILTALQVPQFIGRVLSPVLKGLLGLPPSAVAALMTGFLRKEIAVGMLAPLGLSVKQLVVASVVLTVYVPCIASLVVLFREFGLKDTAKVLAIMILASLVAGGLLNWIL